MDCKALDMLAGVAASWERLEEGGGGGGHHQPASCAARAEIVAAAAAAGAAAWAAAWAATGQAAVAGAAAAAAAEAVATRGAAAAARPATGKAAWAGAGGGAAAAAAAQAVTTRAAADGQAAWDGAAAAAADAKRGTTGRRSSFSGSGGCKVAATGAAVSVGAAWGTRSNLLLLAQSQSAAVLVAASTTGHGGGGGAAAASTATAIEAARAVGGGGGGGGNSTTATATAMVVVAAAISGAKAIVTKRAYTFKNNCNNIVKQQPYTLAETKAHELAKIQTKQVRLQSMCSVREVKDIFLRMTATDCLAQSIHRAATNGLCRVVYKGNASSGLIVLQIPDFLSLLVKDFMDNDTRFTVENSPPVVSHLEAKMGFMGRTVLPRGFPVFGKFHNPQHDNCGNRFKVYLTNKKVVPLKWQMHALGGGRFGKKYDWMNSERWMLPEWLEGCLRHMNGG